MEGHDVGDDWRAPGLKGQIGGLEGFRLKGLITAVEWKDGLDYMDRSNG